MSVQYDVNAKGEETFGPEFLENLKKLNTIVVESSSKLEGNLFYFHQSEIAADTPPAPGRVHKRRNYMHAVKHKKHVLEIGFNAGHSALIAMSVNPTLKFTAVDIARNDYTRKCAVAFKQMFGDRFEILYGDSRDVLPALAVKGRSEFDLLHVDGGHGLDNCRTDIANCIRLGQGGGKHLLLDDTGDVRIFDIWLEFVSSGHLITESLGGRWDFRENLLALIA